MFILDLLSWPLLIGGGLISVVAGIGLLRFPDLYTRMHAASMMDTLGAGCVCLGLVLQTIKNVLGPEDEVTLTPYVAFKLLLIFGFLAFTTSTAGHALAKSALASGVRPKAADGSPLPVGGVLASDDSAASAQEASSSQP